MCILFVYRNPDADSESYRLILASNRDEYFKRPTLPAHYWENHPDCLGGIDMEPSKEGGTWLAVSVKGKAGVVLNLTNEHGLSGTQKKGRGPLVPDFVTSNDSATSYLDKLHDENLNGHPYNPFMLVLINLHNADVNHLSSSENSKGPSSTQDTILGFSNSGLDVPYKKVEAGKEIFRNIVTSAQVSKQADLIEELIKFLKLKERHLPDSELQKRCPMTYNELSSIFITGDEYCTRTHSVLLVTGNNELTFIEETLMPDLTWKRQIFSQINALREESIKEWFVSYKKIPILIYEAIQIDIWKHKVFPRLIEIGADLKNTFVLFTIFYHENIVVSLLENVLFHCESAETIDDSALDLVDYAVKCVSVVLDVKGVEIYESVKDSNSCLEEVLEKKKELEFDIGMRCVSILRYLAEFADNLPLCVLSRMLATHDVPYLLVQLIESRPWGKENEEGENMIYNAGWKKGKSSEEGRICKIEGQVWFGLRELLLNPKCAPYYEITEHRLSHLLKLQKYLHETVLDQISPLIELKRWLSYLSLSASQSKAPRGVNVELMPQIKSSIVEKYHKKWKKLAKNQSKFIYESDAEYFMNAAAILSDAYDFDKLDCIDAKECFLCHEPAVKRCSNCKNAWYCGRECQVKDWAKHKVVCDMVRKNIESKQKE